MPQKPRVTSTPEPSDAPAPSSSSLEQNDTKPEQPQEGAPGPERDQPADTGGVSSVAGLGGDLLRVVGVLALVATIVARGLAPALPGSAAGIGGWIRASGTISRLLSQLLVVSGALVVFRLIIRTLRQSELGVVYRLMSVPLGAAALTIIMAAAQGAERPTMALALAVITSIVAIAATFPTLAAPRTRAAGFVLGLVGTASFVHVLARVLAIHASEQALASLFTMAQSVSTLSFVLDVASIALVGAWLGARSRSRATVVAVVLVGISALIAWGAVRGSGDGASLWQVLASRSMAGLTQGPAPLVLAPLRYAVEILALLTAAAALAVPRRDGAVQALLALALLTRTSTDIPLCALCLIMAALLGPLAALAEKSASEPADRGAYRTAEASADAPQANAGAPD